MDDLPDWLQRMRAVSEQRREARKSLFAALPCSSCVFGSSTARACEHEGDKSLGEGDAGCKHASRIDDAKQQADREWKRKRSLAAAGVNLDSQNPIVRGTLTETKALSAVTSVLGARAIRWLVLAGPPGTGKTMAALHALSVRNGLFATSGDLARPRPLDEAKGWTIENARKAELLVIDDLGIEPRTEYAAAQVEEVVCGREYTGLTIITTNLASDKIAATYGARVSSRLTGKLGLWASCTGKDERIGAKELGTRGEKP